MAGNNTKMNISYTIRAIDKFTKTHEKLERQLSEIERVVNRVTGDKTINIDANTRSARRKMDELERATDKATGNRFINIIVTGYKDARRKLDRIADFSRDIGEINRGFLVGGIISTIAPMLETVAGGLGAIASAGASAGLGFGGFAAIAIPMISGVAEKYGDLQDAREKLSEAKTEEEVAKATEELEAAQSKFNKTQLKSVDALDKFNKFFGEFSKQFEKPILGMFNDTLSITQDLLETLEPAIEGIVGAMENLIDAFQENLDADDMREFFDWVGRTAGPNFETLLSAVGNFLAGFANMLVAFDPLAQGFLDGFLGMSESFRNWADTLEDNQAFQDFVDSVQENTPLVLEFLGNIVTTMWEIIEAMTPFAMKVIEVANGFLDWLTQMMETHGWFKNLVGIIGVGIGVFAALAAPVFILGGIFSKVLTPIIKTVWGWFGTLAGFLRKNFVKVLLRAGGFLLRFAGPIGLIASVVAAFVIALVSNWDTVWASTKRIWGNVKDWISEKVQGIVGTAALVKVFIDKVVGYFKDLRDKVLIRMTHIWQDITGVWDDIMSFLRDIDLSDIGRNIMDGLKNGIKSAADGVVSAAKGVVGNAIQGAKNLLDIHSPSRVFREIGEFTGEGLAIGITDMRGTVEKASERLAASTLQGRFGNAPVFNGVNPQTAPNTFASNKPAPTPAGDTYNYQGMLDGATFVVREETDIEKIAKGLGEHVRKTKRIRGQRT